MYRFVRTPGVLMQMIQDPTLLYRGPGCSSWLRGPELCQLSQSKAPQASAGFPPAYHRGDHRGKGPLLLAVYVASRSGGIKMSGVIFLLGFTILIYSMRHSVFMFAQMPFPAL